MISWYEIPFVRILIPFTAGIFISHYSGIRQMQDIHSLILLILFALVISLFACKNQVHFFGVICFVSIFSIGFIRNECQVLQLEASPLFNFENKKLTAVAKTMETVISENQIRLKIRLRYIGPRPDQLKRTSDLVYIYLRRNSNSENINSGQILLFKGYLNQISQTRNPFVFDYKKYLFHQNIQFRGFISESNWSIIGYEKSIDLVRYLKNRQKVFLEVFKRYLSSPEELSIASAMVLGDRSQINEEVYDAYKETGSIHVLAVSGLHIGVLASFLYFTLAFIRINTGLSKWIKGIFILIAIWAFAILTGGSPSVLRAATMFSIVFFSKMIKNDQNTFNLIAISAFGLLLYDPFLIMQLGFQFSYLAVISILIFYPQFSKLCPFSTNILKYAWKILSVAISAQLLIFPLNFFYFHQFPVYFWISALFVVPFAGLIIMGGLGLITIHFLSPLFALNLSFIYQKIIGLFLKLVFLVQQLPGSTIENVNFNITDLTLSYLFLFGLIGLIYVKRVYWLVWMLGILACLMFSHMIIINKIQSQEKLVIYNIRSYTLMDIYIGNTCYTLSNPILEQQKSNFYTQNNRIHSGIRNLIELDIQEDYCDAHLRKENDLIQISDKLIYIPKVPDNRILRNVDFLLISNWIIRDSLFQISEYKTNVIIDHSMAAREIIDMKKKGLLPEHGIYETFKSGCLEINL